MYERGCVRVYVKAKNFTSASSPSPATASWGLSFRHLSISFTASLPACPARLGSKAGPGDGGLGARRDENAGGRVVDGVSDNAKA
ncbi:hypothetical protein E2C01_019263 [Portunus trituberculatus]|uniref:Uncharacterized protein n=1 Tax=Portunus trituberculatus TaxID=210409 RepID=A0A5B7DWS9_PORTR|nr:hypothetical protein [Portunus trituberculatus]